MLLQHQILEFNQTTQAVKSNHVPWGLFTYGWLYQILEIKYTKAVESCQRTGLDYYLMGVHKSEF